MTPNVTNLGSKEVEKAVESWRDTGEVFEPIEKWRACGGRYGETRNAFAGTSFRLVEVEEGQKRRPTKTENNGKLTGRWSYRGKVGPGGGKGPLGLGTP